VSTDGRRGVLVSVVIPCLNEAQAIGGCVRSARQALRSAGFEGEVLVADNGSTDGSRELARAAGAQLVEESRRGYGRAYQAGFAAARGKYIVMGDGDETYDFSAIGRFIEGLEEGSDLVIGSRLRGTIHPGAMSWLHRYVGNPLLTGLLNVLHGAGVSDAYCGMRAFRRDLLPLLDLRAPGMELASEQLIRASELGLTIREIPIEYRRRRGESKLSPLRDGWRTVRLLIATALRGGSPAAR
jgi:glycosyltransferase involved in cell wall biosynthesis